MKKLNIVAAGLIAGGAIVTAAVMPGKGSIATSGNSTLIATPGGVVTVTPVNNDIFRISRAPFGAGNFTLPSSQSAVLFPEGDPAVFATADEVVFATPTTRLSIDRRTGRSTFMNADGDTLLTEAGGVDNSGPVKTVSLLNGRAQNLYGAGERGHSLRLNGDTLVNFNRQNYGYTGSDPRISQMGITAPWFVSDAGYGVLFDDYNASKLILGKDSITYVSETPKPLSYYFVNGNGSMRGATSNYTLLTGRQDLPPFWALGYITSKYGYHNQQEALGAIDSLKRLDYPVDGIVFDLYWYGKETDMGRLAWNDRQFPDRRMMLDSLNGMGVHTVLINQPYINKIGAIDNYNELAAGNMLTRDSLGNPHDVTTWVGEAGMLDISNPATRAWIWNKLGPLTGEGLSGWWGDLGEPEVHPLTIRHANGETASQFHNVYGNEWSKLIYEGLRRDYPDMRPLLMMRGGTAGLQRYSVFPWTTDVSRSWGGFEPQVKLMLNSGLSGLGYISSDIGGFAVDPEHPYDPELYVRWLQMGAFTPMLRTHAQQKPEPYHYPKQNDIILNFIRQRYQWLPYNYSLAYENAAFGLPLVRPLNFHTESTRANANVADEYLWGSEVLIAPVFKQGARSRKVTFPEGSEWIDWNHPSLKYKGGTTATVKAPLEELPMFVREGAFIPLFMKNVANTSEYDPTDLTVKYFKSAKESEYVLFDDDRKSPTSLADGEYALTTFRAVPEGKGLNITISTEGNYPGMAASRSYKMELVGVARPASVTIDGKPSTDWKYNSATRTLTATVDSSISLK